MRTTRVVLVLLGAGLLGYGAWLLQHWQTLAQLRQAATWALVGLILHDAIFAPLVAALGWLVSRLFPQAVATALASLGIVLVSLTVGGFAVLGRSGDGGLNHTLLDRDYVSGWLGASIVIVLAYGVGAMAARIGRARGRWRDGIGPGRR
ncbi:hypothetical protein [Nocardioides nematodiphilus]|uniref:hypothetical protein n=1 Tax=Nocardioides nematodiphilus TaxID=2849669 RepID=UPI001CD976BD|nr:hypothetical protein [Nocardioides nematodiphilus]MCA1981591.1 hypothetical protein [Nocardioides nematodiphilus]